nr:hypothetical protein [Mycolicibacterium sarraceniae]
MQEMLYPTSFLKGRGLGTRCRCRPPSLKTTLGLGASEHPAQLSSAAGRWPTTR